MRNTFYVFIFIALTTSLNAQWVQTNGPFGGGAYTICISQNGSIFIGTSTGIYKSSDNGNSWGICNSNSYYVLGTNLNNIYTSNFEGWVYKSSDNGITWNITDTLSTRNRKFRKSSVNSLGYIFLASDSGVFRSIDNGNHWTTINNGIIHLSITDIEIKDNNIFAGTADGGIYYSTNNGDFWIQKNFGLPVNSSIHSIELNSQGFVFTKIDSSIYISTNNGGIWTRVCTNPNGYYMYRESFKINNADYLYSIGNKGLFISSNNGVSWSILNSNIYNISNTTYGICFNSFGNIFINSDNNILRSTNFGTSFSVLSQNLKNCNIYSIFKDNNSQIFAGSGGELWFEGPPSGYQSYHPAGTGNGIFTSIDMGCTWVSKNSGIPDSSRGIYCISKSLDGSMLIGTNYSRIYRSTNNGDLWSQVYMDSYSNKNNEIRSIAVKQSNGYIFACGGLENGGILRSTNNGINWTLLSTNLFYNAKSISINSQGDIYVGDYAGIFMSSNNGLNWSTLNNGLGENRETYSIMFYPFNKVFACTQMGLFRSENNGVSWTRIDSNLINKAIFSVTTNSFGVVLAGGVQGLFKSTDFGNNWVKVTDAGSYGYIFSLTVNNDDYLFAGIYGRSVYKSINTINIDKTIEFVPQIFRLFQNYPNPFNPKTSIKFELPKSENVRILVLDALGREIESLVNEKLSPGTYEITWDGSKYSSGVYFYRLQAGEFTETKRMTLIK